MSCVVAKTPIREEPKNKGLITVTEVKSLPEEKKMSPKINSEKAESFSIEKAFEKSSEEVGAEFVNRAETEGKFIEEYRKSIPEGERIPESILIDEQFEKLSEELDRLNKKLGQVEIYNQAEISSAIDDIIYNEELLKIEAGQLAERRTQLIEKR